MNALLSRRPCFTRQSHAGQFHGGIDYQNINMLISCSTQLDQWTRAVNPPLCMLVGHDSPLDENSVKWTTFRAPERSELSSIALIR